MKPLTKAIYRFAPYDSNAFDGVSPDDFMEYAVEAAKGYGYDLTIIVDIQDKYIVEDGNDYDANYALQDDLSMIYIDWLETL